ncbi:hypothetical protein GCM10027276_10260 [Comamonas piscis]
MNCVQCGEALDASAKFCRKCGCKLPAVLAPEAAASARAAPLAAYATCPDCGALCNGQALFCKQCGCRFEETPGFQDTAPDWDTPLSVAEEKAILVFGNVQDSSEPSSTLPGERIQTSAAMVIGGTAALSAAAVPAPALREPEAPLWEPAAAAKRPSAAAPDPGLRPRTSANASASLRNPMPEAPVPQSGQGLRIVLALLGVVVLAGGGAWWWKSQQGRPAAGAAVAAPSVSAPTAPVAADAAVPVEAAAPAMVETDAALAPNETLVAPTPAEDAVAAAVAVEEAAAPAPAAAPARPVPRKPARPQTLDDLLN